MINLYFVFILDFSLELEQEETDSINKLLYTLNHKCEYYHKLYNMFHHAYHHSIVPVIMDTSHHIRDHYCWIYNYLYKQCLSPLMLWVRTPLMAKCSWYNIMWKSLSVTCGRSLVFPRVLLFPPHWYFVKPFIIIAPHEPFTRKFNGPCVTEVQCTLQRGELALCTNNRIRDQSIARLKLPVDIA